MIFDDAGLTRELGMAAQRAVAAKRRLDQIASDAPEYQGATVAYLQATVLHLSIVSVAQARQYEALAADIDELREELVRARAG